MKIPVRNVYYLLLYAWDRLDEAGLAGAVEEGAKDLPNLFARVLDSGLRHLLRRGLDRSYIAREEDISGVRGRIDLAATVRRQLPLQGKTHCRFEELSYDVSQNRIIKATLRLLMRAPELDPGLHAELAGLFRRLDAVGTVRLNPREFRTVQIHRNNRLYGFLLQVCHFIQRNAVVGQAGKLMFREFVRDEDQMQYVFQRFVFNFYRREQRSFRVQSPRFRWLATTLDPLHEEYLPGMATDVVLESADRTIVIDTKYYAKPLQERYGRQTVNSANLYQIFAYLSNYPNTGELSRRLEGVLLYPTVSQSFRFKYRLHAYPLTVCTVDLDQPWRQIEAELLDIIAA